jgi:hypothetical protein
MKINNSTTLETVSSFDVAEESAGIVVKTRDETNKNSLGVYIPRLMAGINIKDGKYAEMSQSLSTDRLKNTKNKSIYGSTVNVQNYIEIPMFLLPNMTMPYFVKGERVTVRFVDKDIKNPILMPFSYQDTRMRMTDDVSLVVASKPEDKEKVDETNSYFLRINSRDQYVKLQTNMANEENNEFVLLIDTKNGIVSFRDIVTPEGEEPAEDGVRSFTWSFNDDKMKVTTEGGIIWTFEKAAISAVCETFDLKASESVNIETSKYTLKADESLEEVTDMVVKDTNYTTEGSEIKFNYPNWTAEGTKVVFKYPTGFFDTAAFSVNGVVLAAGLQMGAAPSGASSTPPNAAGSKASGDSASKTDYKAGSGKTLCYSEPIIAILEKIAKVADAAMGLANDHGHSGKYKPLADVLGIPSLKGPTASLSMESTMTFNSKKATIATADIKG